MSFEAGDKEIGVETFDHEDTYSYMPVLVEVDKQKGSKTKVQMIENFYNFMEADDSSIVKKSQAVNTQKSQKNQEKLKTIYKAVIDTFRQVFDASEEAESTELIQFTKKIGNQESHTYDLVNNPLLSLQTIVKEHSVEEISINDQIIRFFDRESRLYLANLCEKIYDYDGEMLQLDEESYEAPFYPGKDGEKNRRKAFSIFSAVPEAFVN